MGGNRDIGTACNERADAGVEVLALCSVRCHHSAN